VLFREQSLCMLGHLVVDGNRHCDSWPIEALLFVRLTIWPAEAHYCSLLDLLVVVNDCDRPPVQEAENEGSANMLFGEVICRHYSYLVVMDESFDKLVSADQSRY